MAFKGKRKWIKEMASYIHMKHCYRIFILNHFNQNIKPCGNCSNCRSKFFKVDKTTDTKKYYQRHVIKTTV